MQVANPKRAQFKKNSIFIPSDFPHFLKSTIGKELAPSKTALVPPFPILLKTRRNDVFYAVPNLSLKNKSLAASLF